MIFLVLFFLLLPGPACIVYFCHMSSQRSVLILNYWLLSIHIYTHPYKSITSLSQQTFVHSEILYSFYPIWFIIPICMVSLMSCSILCSMVCCLGILLYFALFLYFQMLTIFDDVDRPVVLAIQYWGPACVYPTTNRLFHTFRLGYNI